MRTRAISLLVAAASTTLGSSCPGSLAKTRPIVVDVAPAPREVCAAPMVPPPTIAAVSTPTVIASPIVDAPVATPSSTDVLPPELADDEPPSIEEPESALKAEPHKIPEHALASTARETWIFAEPRSTSRKLGYLRAGAIVERDASPASRAGCAEGWYRVAPRGFVCVGPRATLELRDEVVEAASRRPDRTGLPYAYALSDTPSPLLYARLPTSEEATRAEPDLARHLRSIAQHAIVAMPDTLPLGVPPPWIAAGRSAPWLSDEARSPRALVVSHPAARSGFALISAFEAAGRRYGVTTELALLPLDRARLVEPSRFTGLALDGDVHLPVAFVMRHHARRLVPDRGGLSVGAPYSFREAVELTGNTRRSGDGTLLEAKDGSFVHESEVVKIDAPKELPGWAQGHRKWIDVSIAHQTLVAYVGKKPAYVTLVSTGADGLDTTKEHATVQGLFRIHTKHVSKTMDDDAEDAAFDFRDVPFVQYFTEGFALHAAYWHDDFGTPRSHGCVNLSPKDAAWLFGFTDPEVPEAWHAALSFRGTLVRTRP